MQLHDLPLHPTALYPKEHSLAGQAVRALHVDRSGRARFPILGGAPDDPPPAPTPDPAPTPAPTPDPGPKKNEHGYPDGVRWQDMEPAEQAAYWRHQSQKHEGRYKNLVGDRSYDDVKKDLEQYAEYQRSQQTPAEQQLNERYEQGKQDATSEANTRAARAILRANLRTNLDGDTADEEIEEIIAPIDVKAFIVDGDIDTEKLASFASRFTKAGTANEDPGHPDYGGGRRRQGDQPRGSRGKAEAARRFGKKTTDD